MKNYEFVTFNNKIGSFFNGEYVYQKKNISDGIVSIIQGQNIATTSGGGFSGLFSPRGDDSYIVVEDGTNHCVRKVISVSNDNNTIIVDIPFSFTSSSANFTRTAVAKAYLTKNSQIVSGSDTFIVLTDSAANSTVFFSNNSVLIGEISGTTISNAYFNDILVHSTEPHVYVHTPSQTTFTSREIFGYTSSDDINGVLSSPEMSFNVSMYSPTNLDTGGQPVMLKSRSNEVVLQNWSSSVKSKSSRLEYDIVTTNDWSSPQIDYNSTDVFFNRFIINNDASNENTLNGNAISKHITTKVNFAREAEDILVYLQAYKPPHTDIKVYAKLYNSKDTDYFVDKDWTELVEASGSRTSSISNLQDFVEYTYGLKTSPPVDMPIPGVCHVTADSSTVTGVGVNYTSYLAGGDLIKIYPNLFPQNYVIYSVYNVANATSIVLNTPVSSSDVASLGNQVSSYPTTVPIIANTSGIDYINNVLLIDNSNNTFKYGDKVEYIIKSTQKPIPTLTGNREYYVSFANNSAVALSVNYGGSNVDLGTNINANTSGVNNTSGMIYINNANAYYSVGDRVYYSVPAGNTAISGLVANNNYFVTYSDNTGIVVATSLGAANATITESRTGTAEVHQFIINNAIAAKQVLSTSVNGLVIQKLEEPHQAFINTRNNNTVRYFNSSMTIFDKYDTFALKVVMLSDSQFIIPKISNIRAVGVSA